MLPFHVIKNILFYYRKKADISTEQSGLLGAGRFEVKQIDVFESWE